MPRPDVTAVYDHSWIRAFRPGTSVLHLIPLQDLRPHRAGLDCECRPQIMPGCAAGGGIGTFILHVAWDCREFLHQDSEASAARAQPQGTVTGQLYHDDEDRFGITADCEYEDEEAKHDPDF
jgi:hypothetical protein